VVEFNRHCFDWRHILGQKKGKNQSGFFFVGAIVWFLAFGLARTYIDARPEVIPWKLNSDMEVTMIAAIIGLVAFFIVWFIYEQATGESTDNWYDPPKF